MFVEARDKIGWKKVIFPFYQRISVNLVLLTSIFFLLGLFSFSLHVPFRGLSVSHYFPDLPDYFTLLFLLFSLPSLSPVPAPCLHSLFSIPPPSLLPSLLFIFSLFLIFITHILLLVFYPFLHFLDENLFCLYSFHPISFIFCLLSVISLLHPWSLLLFPPPPLLCPPGH